MGTLIDLTGQRFGRLTVLYRVPNKRVRGSAVWMCRCDCGNEKEVSSSNLRTGQTRSCGCAMHNPTTYRDEVFSMAPMPKPITIQFTLVIGGTYRINGISYKLVGLYDNYARFEAPSGQHDCWTYWELERMLHHG